MCCTAAEVIVDCLIWARLIVIPLDSPFYNKVPTSSCFETISEIITVLPLQWKEVLAESYENDAHFFSSLSPCKTLLLRLLKWTCIWVGEVQLEFHVHIMGYLLPLLTSGTVWVHDSIGSSLYEDPLLFQDAGYDVIGDLGRNGGSSYLQQYTVLHLNKT